MPRANSPLFRSPRTAPNTRLSCTRFKLQAATPFIHSFISTVVHIHAGFGLNTSTGYALGFHYPFLPRQRWKLKNPDQR
ncbi:hypothetical protein NQZ68_032477 [Dissostichus eleginoides]|nr:hypothetical protein NQZ68_032477 [Dissostichus eleginoides]